MVMQKKHIHNFKRKRPNSNVLNSGRDRDRGMVE